MPSDGYLALTCGVSGDPLVYNPYTVLSTASNCHFVSSCTHDPAAELKDVDKNAYYITPAWDPVKGGQGGRGGIGVVAVHGNEDLRFFALACGIPGVVRLNACLKCCLDVCRSSGKFQFVVC